MIQGHKCTNSKLFLIEEIMDESRGVLEGKGKDLIGTYNSLYFVKDIGRTEISLTAITGAVGPRIMRIKRRIGMQWIVILIETGSTCNFVDPSMARKA